MGRDKAGLRLGSRTFLAHIQAEAQKLGLPLRTIRRDLIPACGPLSGIYTALRTTRADAELFLACDMPFVSVELLETLLASWRKNQRSLFTLCKGKAGFPFLLPARAWPIVERQISIRQFSLQELAAVLKARLIRPPRAQQSGLLNVNAPADLQTARECWARRIHDRKRSGCCRVKKPAKDIKIGPSW